VLDQFLGIYSPLIKHVNKDYFIDLCYQVRGEQRPAKKIISALDVGIEGIEDDSDSEAWTIKDGVSPDMLKEICMREDISHYCFDITRKCFSKHISKHRNYPALIYYCINNHMKKRREKWEGRKILFLRIFWLIILKITGMGGFKGFRIIRLKILKSFFNIFLL
jgi:hypothetical protein